MFAKSTVVAVVLAACAALASAGLQAQQATTPTKEEGVAAPAKAAAETPKKHTPKHSHVQEKNGGNPGEAPAKTTDSKSSKDKNKLHIHSRDAK